MGNHDGGHLVGCGVAGVRRRGRLGQLGGVRIRGLRRSRVCERCGVGIDGRRGLHLREHCGVGIHELRGIRVGLPRTCGVLIELWILHVATSPEQQYLLSCSPLCPNRGNHVAETTLTVPRNTQNGPGAQAPGPH